MDQGGGGLAVAVVDDDQLILSILTDALSSGGHQVRGFRSGEEALERLWDTPVDVLVTDLMLPRMSGFDLLRELRDRPWAHHTPCLGITGLSWGSTRIREFLSAAPTRLLRKPFDVGVMLGTIRAMFDERPDADLVGMSVDKAEDERRRSPRVRMNAKVQVRFDEPRDLMTEYTENLSHDGLFIRSLEPLPVESTVDLSISLPFRAEPVELSGTVVRSIGVHSPQARFSPAGMAIALTGMPASLRHEFAAYVAGFRAGIASQSQPAPQHSVLLAGVESVLPRQSAAFLERSTWKSVWLSTWTDVERQLAAARPHLVVAHEGMFEGDPRAWHARLLTHYDGPVAILARKGTSLEGLPPQIERLDVSLPPSQLHERLARLLAVHLRAHPRAACQALARAQRVDGTLSAIVDNISLGGLSLVTDEACGPGESLVIDFELPGDFGAVRATLTVLRVTATSSDEGKGRRLRVGARFSQLSPDSVDAVRRFVEAKTARC